MKDRFRFAQMHKDWNVSDWEQVMKLKNVVSNLDGRSWCWIEDKENIHVRVFEPNCEAWWRLYNALRLFDL